MTFAVIQTGGKQYKVAAGETLKIEKIIGEFSVGDKLDFENVLLVDTDGKTEIGTPILSNKKVSAEIVEIGKSDKVEVVKYKAKSRYHKRNGHRQPFFKVKITDIK